MKLADKLSAIVDGWTAPEPYVHKEETAEQLFNMIIKGAEVRAKSGCRTMIFQWERIVSKDKSEWQRRHQICLEVVDMLKEENFKAWAPDNYEEPHYNDYGELVNFGSRHSIELSWGHPWDPY